MANYLITGVAGFIGARVAETLLDEGHLVWGCDNLNDAYDVRMKHWRLNRLKQRSGEDSSFTKQTRFIFRQIDISDFNALMHIDFDIDNRPIVFDAIINLAARAGVRQSVENPWIYLETNLTGTLNLLELCRRLNITKFVLASTSSVYGANAPLPTPEEANSDLPLQPYAASKKAAESLCHAYHFLYGIDVTIFRYFTVYGPAGRPDMSMFRFTQWIREGRPLKINGDGEQSRGYTYIDDIARGTILGVKPVGYEIFNLGGHESIKINDLVKILESKIGKKAQIEHLPAHPADMLANWANVEKAGRHLNWKPHTSLHEGISNLVAWYEEERSWASQIETS
jgi:nucleoside-diphosphate-sugar epimerase